jgi:hypothetical protein
MGPDRNLLSLREREDPRPGPLRDVLHAETAGCRVFRRLREQVLERDGHACRVCGDPDPGVHHREPGKSVLHLMIALCAGCHAKVHRTKVVLTEFPPLLLILWREQHPQGHEQTYLDFNVLNPPAQRVPLNFEPAQKD